jgi:hypothetical protein
MQWCGLGYVRVVEVMYSLHGVSVTARYELKYSHILDVWNRAARKQ